MRPIFDCVGVLYPMLAEVDPGEIGRLRNVCLDKSNETAAAGQTTSDGGASSNRVLGSGSPNEARPQVIPTAAASRSAPRRRPTR